MHIPPSIHAGDLLEIRRRRWRVLDVRAYERCQLITVTGLDPAVAGVQRQFLSPFDVIKSLERARPPRLVRPRRWRHACRGVLAEYAPPETLRTARLARMDLLPYQLEPALAIVRGRASRVLLADDVGLGKTIQAGLIIAELRARGQADRVLILTPSGLRDQWRGELAGRFGIDAAVADVDELRRRSLTMAAGQNPWVTTPIAISSIDYVKRPEVLPAVQACRWDVMVVDEAHGAGRDTDRHLAVRALSLRAPYVLLLTASPHNGDRRAFAALCGIGALGDPLLVFRRTRTDVKSGVGRRVHRLDVRASAAESRMYALLSDFTRIVRTEHRSTAACLALSVLHKRAFSSARSLELTVGRRLEALGGEADGGFRQLVLPLFDPGGELDHSDDPPDCLAPLALADARRERGLLGALGEAAKRAADGETKIAALRRLLRRVAEPVLVFTEFRDTLLHLREALGQPVLLLHGGLTRGERQAALRDFSGGVCRILLATDAGGEGLNLHHRCRLVVNLELPWNPIRLEQRVGRVDRIGQLRTVHAIHFVAAGTGESRILDRLRARVARAREDIPAGNPVEEDEHAIAAALLEANGQANGQANGNPAAGGAADQDPEESAPARLTIDLGGEAAAEAARVAVARRLSSDAGADAAAALDATAPWLTRARRAPSRARLGRRAIAILRIDHVDGGGHLFDRTLVPVSFVLPAQHRFDRRHVKEWWRDVEAHLRRFAQDANRRRGTTTGDTGDGLLAVRFAREIQIAQALAAVPRPAVQPGLFDRRAERISHMMGRTASESADDSAAHLALLERRRIITPRPARLLLVLVP